MTTIMASATGYILRSVSSCSRFVTNIAATIPTSSGRPICSANCTSRVARSIFHSSDSHTKPNQTIQGQNGAMTAWCPWFIAFSTSTTTLLVRTMNPRMYNGMPNPATVTSFSAANPAQSGIVSTKRNPSLGRTRNTPANGGSKNSG